MKFALQIINNMETTLQQTISTTYNQTLQKQNLFSRFISWCDGQEKYRFGWLGAALAAHGCIFTPITLFAIILSGNHFYFWILALVAMGSALITNLAALPTKITIPVFLFSILMDIAIIISCVSIGFSLSGTYI
jgi:hypothetical protein